MTTLEITEVLKNDRVNIIARLTELFPMQPIKTSMFGLLEYCVNYEMRKGEDIFEYIDNYRKQETRFQNLGNSSDVNDTIKTIRTNTRNRWGI